MTDNVYTIGLGSNLGKRHDSLMIAIDNLRKIGDVISVSKVYESIALRDGDPHFLNAAVSLKSNLKPLTLLRQLHAIETSLGRDRTAEEHWGPRTIDLDILWLRHDVFENDELSFPHRSLLLRSFAWVPAFEVESTIPTPPAHMHSELTVYSNDGSNIG